MKKVGCCTETSYICINMCNICRVPSQPLCQFWGLFKDQNYNSETLEKFKTILWSVKVFEKSLNLKEKDWGGWSQNYVCEVLIVEGPLSIYNEVFAFEIENEAYRAQWQYLCVLYVTNSYLIFSPISVSNTSNLTDVGQKELAADVDNPRFGKLLINLFTWIHVCYKETFENWSTFSESGTCVWSFMVISSEKCAWHGLWSP